MFDSIVSRVKSFLGAEEPREMPVREPRIITRDEHGIDPELVAWQAKRCCEALQKRGYRAYIVGGAVRDLLLGVTPKDFDVATDATPEEVKRAQRRAIIIGRRFRLVHVIFGEEIIECSTFRALEGAGQRKDATGRVVSDNVFGEMWEDAARRDFTINALYYDPQTQELFDYHRGFEDLAAKRLRMIGDPAERYREDPVRMMRAVRIAAKLGFTIEPATEAPIPKMAKLLENVPSARLVDEVLKLLTSGHAVACLSKLRQEGLHKALLPLLDVIVSEPDGEEFLMLALKRTDERIAVGKKISPSFLFGTLLWPQVVKRWRYNEDEKGMSRMAALHAACVDVLATQCQQLNIQRRYQADIHDLWMLQARFERRTGKTAYALVSHPRYRAAYDFMLLRSLLGHVPESLVQWWDAFALSDEETRAGMIAEAQREARMTGDAARSHRRRAASADGETPAVRRAAPPAAVRSAVMPEAIIALGANLGQPVEALRSAVQALGRTDGIRVLGTSRFYTTSPVESSGPDYVNAAVLVETTLEPMALLRACQAIENAHGRVRPAGVVNAPRTLDLDVIAYEGTVSDDPVLTLPHPRMHERLFVLVPIADLLPDWRLPDGRTVGEAVRDVREAHPDQLIRPLGPENMA